MPPNPKRKSYPWFDNYNRKDNENYRKNEYEEKNNNKIVNIREMEIQRAIRMIHKINDIYEPLIDIIEYQKVIFIAIELHGIKGTEILLKMVDQNLSIGFKRCKL